jgi:F-type H+-transporting ATPase subunit gamma
MSSTLEITQKIQSLTNIQKVTQAMHLIASIRHRKLAARVHAIEQFETGLMDWLGAVVPVLVREQDPLTRHPTGLRRVAVALTSDRGLCGSHNHAVCRALDALAAEARSEGRALEVMCLGSRGAVHARRRGYNVTLQIEAKTLEPEAPAVGDVADRIMEVFLRGEIGTVDLVYDRYVSTLRQTVRVQTVLPLDKLVVDERPEPHLDRSETFGQETAYRVVRYWLALAVAHSMLSEQAARMTAMDNAAKNARELTTRAVKERNRLRQAGITTELIEIVSGKEAMKR